MPDHLTLALVDQDGAIREALEVQSSSRLGFLKQAVVAGGTIAARVDRSGTLWIRARLPVLPNNTTGWIARNSLGGYNTVNTHLVVSTRTLTATLYRFRKPIFSARVEIRQSRWPTPTGHFHIRNKLTRYSSPVYGPLAFGTSARSAVLTDWPAGGFVGIHGTNQPGCGSGRNGRTGCDTRQMSRLHTGFAAVDPPEAGWAPTRARFRPERLEAPLDSLTGVGPTLKKRLAKLGLERIGDLLDHRPRRYERPAPEKRIADLFGEEEVLIQGEVIKTSLRRGRGRLQILTAQVSDGTGQISATWFNQPWLQEKLQPGTRVRLRGAPNRFGFLVRSYDLNGGSATADFAPVYPASEEISATKLRELVEAALPLVTDRPDPLPAALKVERGLPFRGDALAAIHQPRSLDEAEEGRQRLAFDELLVLQLALSRRMAEREEQVAAALPESGELIARYRAALPFELTEHQESAIVEIDRDLSRTTPMQRLLQGDVGSGKTVVALYALLRAVEAGRQGALMAPTETLAEQHFLTIEGLCMELGVSCALVTGSVKSKIGGQADVVVGTHALIQKGFEFRDLAVAVVDEQHRFGVEQRSALTEGRSPHVLHMTATPIPRTLALTVYGDLSVSEIAKPPASRKPVVTAWVTAARSSEAYTRLRAHLTEGRQAYVVCPLIEESATSTARAAEQEAEQLRAGELKGFRVGCMHGRLKPAERRELMARFKAGELDVLVATTVIEVGVDVPNATIMIVQEADRFGLAQLHQLRGRVGRGAEQSYCLLISGPKEELTESAHDRLEALVASTDGFELAEKDLEIRGGGALLGARQSGLSDLRFARITHDRELLEEAREAAQSLPPETMASDVEGLLGESEHLGSS